MHIITKKMMKLMPMRIYITDEPELPKKKKGKKNTKPPSRFTLVINTSSNPKKMKRNPIVNRFCDHFTNDSFFISCHVLSSVRQFDCISGHQKSCHSPVFQESVSQEQHVL